MAKKNGNFISGVLGPLIFRVLNGVQHVGQRTSAGTIKHTDETKRSSGTFALGSSLSAKIRVTVKELLLGLSDSDAKNRLNGSLAHILANCRIPKSTNYQFDRDSFSGLQGYEFNARSPVSRLISAPLPVTLADGTVKLKLPRLEITGQLKFPYKAFQCKISVSVSLFRLRDGLYQDQAQTQTVAFNYHMQHTDPHEFKFAVPKACLCIVSLFLVYESAGRRGMKLINNRNFNPGIICAALMTEGKYEGGDGITWREMKKIP